jgi:hypothetical protein
MSPFSIIDWIVKNLGWLGYITPIVIFYIFVILYNGLVNSWLRFIEAVKNIIKNKWGLLFFLIAFSIFIYYWNQLMGRFQ